MNPESEHDTKAPATTGDGPLPAARSGSSSHLLPLAIGALAFLAMAGGLDALYWLRYEREAILGGEVWRVLTGHLAHMGWAHLVVNLGGLLLIWLIFSRMLGTARWALVFGCCALGVSLGLLLFHPDLRWYVGMSGVLHGMFVAGAVAGIHAGYRAEWLLLGFLALKLGWEQVQGAMPGTEDFVGGLVIVDAHLYGALTGLAVILALIALDRRGAQPRDSA